MLPLNNYPNIDFERITSKPEVIESIADFTNLDTDELLESSIVYGTTAVRLAKIELQALRYAVKLNASIMGRDDYGLQVTIRIPSTTDSDEP
jgi:hypothetical protein